MSTYIKVNTELFKMNLNPTEMLLLALVESFARDNKECYYTNDQLAEMFSVSVSYIKKTLDELEAKNYIKRNTKFIRDRETGKAYRVRSIELVHLQVNKFSGFSF